MNFRELYRELESPTFGIEIKKHIEKYVIKKLLFCKFSKPHKIQSLGSDHNLLTFFNIILNHTQNN